MKNKIFAAILSVLTAASMAACGNGEAGENGGNDVADVTTSAEASETKTETDETESETESEAETESETESETETEQETEAEDGDGDAAADVYTGDGYTRKNTYRNSRQYQRSVNAFTLAHKDVRARQQKSLKA